MKKTLYIFALTIIISSIFVGCASKKPDPAVETTATEKTVVVPRIEASTVAQLEIKKAPVSPEFQYTAELSDVSGGTATGVAEAGFSNDTYSLYATFEDLPDPEGTDFYEGWIVRESPLDVLSTGKAIQEEGSYINEYTSSMDLIGHESYVLTLEPDDGDPAPSKHILEGDLTAK